MPDIEQATQVAVVYIGSRELFVINSVGRIDPAGRIPVGQSADMRLADVGCRRAMGARWTILGDTLIVPVVPVTPFEDDEAVPEQSEAPASVERLHELRDRLTGGDNPDKAEPFTVTLPIAELVELMGAFSLLRATATAAGGDAAAEWSNTDDVDGNALSMLIARGYVAGKVAGS